MSTFIVNTSKLLNNYVEKQDKVQLNKSNQSNGLIKFLSENKKYSNFYYIFKLSGLANRYNFNQKLTLFIISNKNLNYNLDKLSKDDATNIINFSTLPTKLDKYYLLTCVNSDLTTYSDINKLNIVNINNRNILDKKSIIINYNVFTNETIIVHEINSILIPYII